MPTSPSAGPPFEVHLSGVIAARLREVQTQATLEGRGDAVLSAFRQIIDRLKRDPMIAGEPLFRLPALRMRVRQVAIRPLYINYAVCEDHPLVFL